MPNRSSIFSKFVFWADAEQGSPSILKDRLIVAANDAWWYAQHYARIYLTDPAEAASITEQALAVMYRRLLNRTESFPSQSKLNAALRREMYRVTKQQAHRQRLEQYAGSSYDLDNLLSPFNNPDLDERILRNQFMAALPVQSRRLLQLRFDGNSWAEIAFQSGTNQDSLRLKLRADIEQVIRELRLQYPGREPKL